jgi:hypothetical protein
MEEVQSLRRKFQRLSFFVAYDEGISHIFNLQLVVVVEMPQNAPANLNFQHLDALLLESDETIHTDASASLLLRLLLDDVFDCPDVLGVQLGLEDPLLETAEIGIRQGTRQLIVENPEDSDQGLSKFGRNMLRSQVVEWSQGIENCPLGRVEYFLHISIVGSRALDAHLNLPIVAD